MFKSTYSRSLAIRILGSALAVGQTLILARYLGAEVLGVYSSLLAITTLLAMPIAAGVPTFLTREIARARASGDIQKVRPLIKAGGRIATIAASVSVAVFWFLYWLGLVPARSWIYMIALSILIPLLGLDLIRAGAMRGMSSALKSQLPENIIRPLLFVLSLSFVIFLMGSLDLLSAILAFATACGASFIVGRFMLARMIPRKASDEKRVPSREVLASTAALAVLGGSTTLIGNLDILVLSAFGAFQEAGAYKVAFQGVVLVLMIHNAVGAVALRDMAETIGKRDLKSTVFLADKATILSTSGTACILLIIAVFGKIGIVMLFGQEYIDAYLILLILGLGHVISSSMGPVFEILVMLNSQKSALMANLLSIMLLIFIAVLLVQWSPALGVAVASATANVFRNLFMARIVSSKLGFDPTLIGVFKRKKTA